LVVIEGVSLTEIEGTDGALLTEIEGIGGVLLTEMDGTGGVSLKEIDGTGELLLTDMEGVGAVSLTWIEGSVDARETLGIGLRGRDWRVGFGTSALVCGSGLVAVSSWYTSNPPLSFDRGLGYGFGWAAGAAGAAGAAEDFSSFSSISLGFQFGSKLTMGRPGLSETMLGVGSFVLRSFKLMLVALRMSSLLISMPSFILTCSSEVFRDSEEEGGVGITELVV
jgi:hypothetical protein